MAASILRYLVGKRAYVQSAGVRPGDADPFAIAVMDEIGIDMARHEPQTIEDLEDTSFDLIVTLAPEAHHKALELTRTMAVDVEYWPTIDPSATGAAANRFYSLTARFGISFSSASRRGSAWRVPRKLKTRLNSVAAGYGQFSALSFPSSICATIFVSLVFDSHHQNLPPSSPSGSPSWK